MVKVDSLAEAQVLAFLKIYAGRIDSGNTYFGFYPDRSVPCGFCQFEFLMHHGPGFVGGLGVTPFCVIFI